MKRLALALIVSLGLVYPATAGAVETATAQFVQRNLVAHWGTSDGYRVRSADCAPKGSLFVHRGHIFSNYWNCIEVDRISRMFWLHVRISNTPGTALDRPTEYRCSARYSLYRCPR